VHALDELKRCYAGAKADPGFLAEFRSELEHFVGRRARSTTPRA